MRRILITGGLGYIGGRLVKYLLEHTDAEIIVSSRNEANVELVFGSKRVKLTSTQKLIDFDEELPFEIDAIIHLAATNEIQAAADPVDSVRVNVINSYMLLQKAIQHKVKRFIYFSTAHVYCSPLEGIITEDICPKPLHPYAITHKAFEDFLWASNHNNQIEGVIVRLSNSYGAPLIPDVNRWTLVVNDLCRQAIPNNQMLLKSSGLQLRDFITLTDVCGAVHHLLSLSPQRLHDGIFNLGGNHVISVFEMSQLIQQRFLNQFNRPVSLLRTQPDANEKVLPFSFNSSRLEESGFIWKNNVEEELDALIHFCIKNFS